MEITTPFRCSRCDIEFTQNEGGICSSCHKPFCITHLKIMKDGRTIKPICVDCGKKRKREGFFLAINFIDFVFWTVVIIGVVIWLFLKYSK